MPETKNSISKSKDTSASTKVRYITQKEFTGHFSLGQYDTRNLLEDGLLSHNDKNQIADFELSRPQDEIKQMAAGATRHTLTSAGAYMGVSSGVAKALIAKSGVSPVGSYRGQYHNWVSLYAQRDLDEIMHGEAYANSLERAKKRKAGAEKTKNRLAEYEKKIEDRVQVNIRTRENPLLHAHLFMGPTNSGKTYSAIEEMCELYENNPDGKYVYAGPLRLLAYEQYEKLSARYGKDQIGFVTGEEQVNPEAPIVCCTVECAPMRGTAIVLDETHWLLDDDRGKYWTNLLIGGEYEHMYVIAAKEAEDIIMHLLENSLDISSREFERIIPVEFAGKMNVSNIAPRTAVVAFSRKAVFAIAKEISKKSKQKVGVLYGAMPLQARKTVLDMYQNGDYDAIVCTDVIGHGINLPIDNVVMAEAEKFDGKIRRQLKLWECAQIVGRAGRYGLSDSNGKVFVLSGMDWAKPGKNLVEKACRAANGDEPTDISIKKVQITPSFDDLAIEKPVELLHALDAWQKKAVDACRGTVLVPSDMPNKRALVSAIASHSDALERPKATASDNKWSMTAEQLWKLSEAPLDPQSDVLSDIVAWVNEEDREHSDILVRAVANMSYYAKNANMGDDSRIYSRCNENLRRFAEWEQQFKDNPELMEQAATDWEEVKAEEELRRIRNSIKKRNKKHRKEPDYVEESLPPVPSNMTHEQYNKKWQGVPRSQEDIEKKRREVEAENERIIASAKERAAECMAVQERAYKELGQLETIYNVFGSIGNADIEIVKDLVDNVNKAVTSMSHDGVRYNTYGICESCGGQCAPWFFECDRCHSLRTSWRYDDYYDYW